LVVHAGKHANKDATRIVRLINEILLRKRRKKANDNEQRSAIERYHWDKHTSERQYRTLTNTPNYCNYDLKKSRSPAKCAYNVDLIRRKSIDLRVGYRTRPE